MLQPDQERIVDTVEVYWEIGGDDVFDLQTRAHHFAKSLGGNALTLVIENHIPALGEAMDQEKVFDNLVVSLPNFVLLDKLRLPIISLSAPNDMNFTNSFNWLATEVKADGSNGRRKSNLRRELDTAVETVEGVDPKSMLLPCDALISYRDFMTREKYLALSPEIGTPLATLITSQSESCFNALYRHNRKSISPSSPTTTAIPFIRLRGDYSDQQLAEFTRNIKKYLPVYAELVRIRSRAE